MIDEQTRQKLMGLMQTPQWASVEQVANELISEIRSTPSAFSTEWDTLRDTLLREGEARGVERLLKRLYDEAGGK